MTYNGLQGHLVTITSQEEQDFLVSILTADGQTGVTSSGYQLIHPDSHTGDANFYTAGSDRDSEGTHVWLDGPEAGQEVSLSFSPPWGTGQPSSHTEVHDAVTLIGGGQKSPGTYAYQDIGTWKSINDGSAGSYTMSELVGGYIVEYSPVDDGWDNLYSNDFNSSLSLDPSLTLEGEVTTIGGAAYFDGDGDGLIINDVGLSNIGTKDFRISFDFKTDGTQDPFSVILSRFETRDGNFLEIGNGPSADGFFAAIAGSTVYFSGTTPLADLNDDQWHSLEFSRTGSTLNLSIDGQTATADGAPLDSLDLSGIRVGRWQGNNGTDNNFKGYIDNLSIDEKPPSALNFGESNGVSLNLINPYTTSTGKTYYYVDAGGDGSSDTRDSSFKMELEMRYILILSRISKLTLYLMVASTPMIRLIAGR